MKKKLKIVKTTKKEFPKDMRVGAVDKPAVSKAEKVAKTSAEGSLESNKRGQRDPRLPAPGAVIVRKYKGEDLQVKVLENGFEYKSQIFKSISALAVHIVGAPINGYVFFKLGAKND